MFLDILPIIFFLSLNISSWRGNERLLEKTRHEVASIEVAQWIVGCRLMQEI